MVHIPSPSSKLASASAGMRLKLTSSLPQAVKFPGIFIEIFSHAHAKGVIKSLNDFKFDAFVGRFQSDGVESMAVKGLN